MPVTGVTAELLVRYLDAWIPAALHSSRRVTFVQSWPQTADVDAAVAVLRVFAEFSDQLRGRRVSLVFVAPELGDAVARLDGVHADLHAPADLGVYTVAGSARTHLGPILSAAQAGGAPVFTYADAGTDAGAGADLGAVARAIKVGKPAELMLLTTLGTNDEVARSLRVLGFDLVSSVELVTESEERLLMFATRSAKNLEAFKNELWQLDEYAGVSIRDPHDPDGHLLDISLTPQPGPLRREILAYLAGGEHTVTEIRHFALTDTVYRSADVTHVLNTLVTSGGVMREPATGRLAGDTLIGLPKS